MRSLIVMAMFTASLAHAGWLDYEEVRDLELDADGVTGLTIEAGAGSMKVRGNDSMDSIQVTATIQVGDGDEDDAREFIENNLVLSLERDGDSAVLRSHFRDSGWLSNMNAGVALDVDMPTNMNLSVDDSSGSIKIRDVAGDVEIEDSSGSIEVNGVGGLTIDDSSGSIDVSTANGDVRIVDRSGSITVRGVTGSVRINDGSGSIRVSDVEEDVIIEEDGSGGLSVTNVRGNVEEDT